MQLFLISNYFSFYRSYSVTQGVQLNQQGVGTGGVSQSEVRDVDAGAVGGTGSVVNNLAAVEGGGSN